MEENKNLTDNKNNSGADASYVCPLITDITCFGKETKAACDNKCEKAWGINTRPKTQLSEDEDDTVYLTDNELAEAPIDPGTYEWDDAKPMHPDRHNKWCVRECERCKLLEVGEELILADFTKPIYNIPSKHT